MAHHVQFPVNYSASFRTSVFRVFYALTRGDNKPTLERWELVEYFIKNFLKNSKIAKEKLKNRCLSALLMFM
jgi:hypothetical protein